VFEFGKLRSSKLLRTLVLATCFGTVFIALFSELYVEFHYAAVMPRSPQPATGRVYAIPAQYGGTIYVNKIELDRRNFVRDDLAPISLIAVVLCFSVGAWLGWWPKERNPFAGGMARK
jgi:hypothetical protein